jgi:hypothetical protein
MPQTGLAPPSQRPTSWQSGHVPAILGALTPVSVQALTRQSLLHLQSTAGNRAVAALLAKTSGAPAKVRTQVQRCGSVLPSSCGCHEEQGKPTDLVYESLPPSDRLRLEEPSSKGALPSVLEADSWKRVAVQRDEEPIGFSNDGGVAMEPETRGSPTKVAGELEAKVALLDQEFASATAVSKSRGAATEPPNDLISLEARIRRLHEIVAGDNEADKAAALAMFSQEPPSWLASSLSESSPGAQPPEPVLSRQVAVPVPIPAPAPMPIPWWLELTAAGPLLLLLVFGALLESDSPRPRSCETDQPTAILCSSLPSSFGYSSPQAALAALKAQTADPSLRLVAPAPSTGGPCPGVGTHWGVKSGGTYVASISCCPCCEDTPQGPVMRTRCRII